MINANNELSILGFYLIFGVSFAIGFVIATIIKHRQKKKFEVFFNMLDKEKESKIPTIEKKPFIDLDEMYEVKSEDKELEQAFDIISKRIEQMSNYDQQDASFHLFNLKQRFFLAGIIHIERKKEQ